ncbi:Exocyst complex component 4 [Nymphon striatum]|nr:Exocyst complex component 4 [Nymphon striatum]
MGRARFHIHCQDNDQRDREKAKLEKEFKRSDQRLDELVSEHQDALQNTMQSFSKIAARITTSRDRIKDVKEKLMACKMLLHCKRDELKKLWLEEYNLIDKLKYIFDRETLKDISMKIDECMETSSYVQATELLVQAVSLIDGNLDGVDALKEVRNELQGKKDHLYEILVDELNMMLYKVQSIQPVRRINSTNAASRNVSNTTLSPSKWKRAHSFDFHQADDRILPVVQCLHKLNRLPDAIENVKERCQSQLLFVVRNTVKQFSPDNMTPQYNQSSMLHNFLNQVFKQFKEIVHMHEIFLDNIRKVMVADGQHSDLHLYGTAEVWSKIQAVLETVIGEYLDIGNTSTGRQPPHPVFTETTADIATFFARKRNIKPKKYSLFRFDASSHAININNYLKEQRKAVSIPADESNTAEIMAIEEHKLICEPHARNITIIYKPSMAYVEEIEQVLQYSAGNHCPLHSFLNDCVKVFIGQVSENITNSVESTTKSSDAWKPITVDQETNDSINVPRPVLQSTALMFKIIDDLKCLVLNLSVCTDEFLELMCSVLRSYKETCLDAYRGIVQPESEDKRIISATWAKDEDISRLLKHQVCECMDELGLVIAWQQGSTWSKKCPWGQGELEVANRLFLIHVTARFGQNHQSTV